LDFPCLDLREGAVLHHATTLETADLQLANIGDESSRNKNGA
jgi:hypothetical protein